MSTERPDHQELASELDLALAKILRNGHRVINKETGQVQIVDPSAAMLNVIRGRLRDVGATKSSAPPGSAARQLREAAAARGLRLTGTDGGIPDVDVDEEDPAS